MIREATIGDIPWMIEAAATRFHRYDPDDSADYVGKMIMHPDCVVLRGEHSAGAAYAYQWPYNKKIRIVEEVFLASTGKEAYRMLKALIEWAKGKDADHFDFSLGDASITAKSLEPFARRLGACRTDHGYRINLRGNHVR